MQQLKCNDAKAKGIHIVYKDNQENDTIDPRMITATTIIGNKVTNDQGEELGKIEEIVFDLTCGTISYIVMSSGGFAGIADKFFAVPLDALTLDLKDKTFSLKIGKKTLSKSRGFDKNNWPEKAQWPIDQNQENPSASL